VTVFLDIALCSLIETDRFSPPIASSRYQGALMTEAVSTSVKLTTFYQKTRSSISGECHLRTVSSRLLWLVHFVILPFLLSLPVDFFPSGVPIAEGLPIFC
jgi:hypothetical protein